MGITFQIKDAIDIFLVAILMYLSCMWTRNTSAKNIFIGLIAFVSVWFLVTKIFKMELLGSIFDAIFNVGVIALIVIFQDEIRQFFSQIGSRNSLNAIMRLFNRLHLRDHNESPQFDAKPLVDALRSLQSNGFGALIIIAKNDTLQESVYTGEIIDADINTRLIENIFFKNSPLHDGAMIISQGRIVVAGAVLPISRDNNIPKHLGLRHRAAIGISEKTDAVIVVLSEERMSISIVYKGNITQNIPIDRLKYEIEYKMNL